jgi:hypothetical protein
LKKSKNQQQQQKSLGLFVYGKGKRKGKGRMFAGDASKRGNRKWLGQVDLRKQEGIKR